MATVPLRESVTVQLSPTGAGNAKVGPLSAREQWRNLTVSVSANTNPTNDAQCTISVGDVNTKSFRDATVCGSSGDSTRNVTDTVRVGSYVWAEWSGGDANVYATLTVTGDKDL